MKEHTFLVLSVAQLVSVAIYGWVARAYFMSQPADRPMIFWSPLGRLLLTTLPSITILCLIIAAFLRTTHPWWFLVATIIMVMVLVPNPNAPKR